MQNYQKLYAYNKNEDGTYGLKSYWTSSQTVEFDDGQTLEAYKTELLSDIDDKADGIGYSLDEGEVYLYSGEETIATEEMDIRTRPNVALDDISNLSARLANNQIRFTWQDPSDVVFSELTLVEWAGTKVVRNVGSAPNGVSDGTVIIDSKIRDQYSSTPYYDDNISNDTYYYYRFFPYDTDGNYYGKTCVVIIKPTILTPINIPYIVGTYAYTGENITPTFENYDSSVMTRGGTVYAKNAGTYTTTFTPKEGYKWSDDTTQTKEITWSIGKANGYITLSSDNITLDGKTVDSINILDSSNNVSIQSFDSTIIEVEIESNIITISCDLPLATSTVLTLSVAENTNYLSATKTINITINNKEIDTWTAITWSGFSPTDGSCVWSDGDNVYYSSGNSHYVLDRDTNIWNIKTWSTVPASFDTKYLWSDGDNIYYSVGKQQFVLDKENSTWSKKTWNGYSSPYGKYIWSKDGVIYDSEGGGMSSGVNQYVLNKGTSTWIKKTWAGYAGPNGEYFWSDGDNIYYSAGSSIQYVVDVSASKWNKKTWYGFNAPYANNIWTDGKKIYYSSYNTQYVLNKETSTWTAKAWSGLTSFAANYIWTDGHNVYYSNNSEQYVVG